MKESEKEMLVEEVWDYLWDNWTHVPGCETIGCKCLSCPCTCGQEQALSLVTDFFKLSGEIK